MRFKSAAPMNAVGTMRTTITCKRPREFGLPGLLVLLALGGVVIFRAVQAAARQDNARYIAIACIGAFAAIALHSLVDFKPLHPSECDAARLDRRPGCQPLV